MRLIDADKLETDTIYATHLNHVECGYHYSYSEGRINEAPTINAIPIEWIKNYLHEREIISKDNLDLGEDGYFGEVIAIENMLYAWEKENEID